MDLSGFPIIPKDEALWMITFFFFFGLDPAQDIFVMVSRWYGGIHLGWCAEGWEFSLIETWSPWAEL